MDVSKAQDDDRSDSQYLTSIFNNIIDGIVSIDEQGEIKSFNHATLRLFGYEREELLGKNIKSLLSPSFHEQHDAFIHKYLETGEAQLLEEKREMVGKRQDGTEFPFVLSLVELGFLEKHIFTGIIHDMSELKKSEKSRLDTEKRLNAIFNTAVDGIITINQKGVIELVNPAAARLFGYEAEELSGKKINELMPAPERNEHDAYLANYHKTGVGKIIGIGREVYGLKKDGTQFPFRLSISEVKLKEGTIYTGIIHDVSARKEAEEKLKKYARELERSNRELEDFAYISSHDLQEPLRKIQAFGSRVKQKEGDKLSEQGQDYLERMLNASVRMQRLINDLLSYSRVSTRAQPYSHVDLNFVLEEVLSDLVLSIESSNAEISTTPLPEIDADPTQMRQLFQNLIANAIKFTKAGEHPQISITAEIYKRNASHPKLPKEDMIRIYISDKGIGFEEKYLDRIFNIFQRLEGRKYEGSGVGLAICKRIALRHRGDITAKSQPNQGATFIVSLPIHQE